MAKKTAQIVGNEVLESHRRMRQAYNDALYRLADHVHMSRRSELHDVVDHVIELLEFYHSLFESLEEGVILEFEDGSHYLEVKMYEKPEETEEYYDE